MHHAMKAYKESGGTAPHILNPSTRWRWVVSFMPQQLYPTQNILTNYLLFIEKKPH